jgi:hypothetical protein
MIYTISENNEVKIFINEGDENPLIFQPSYPNGTKFESEEDAKEWAEIYISWYNGEEIYVPSFKSDTGEQQFERISEKEQIYAFINSIKNKFDPAQFKMLLKEIVDEL